MQKYSFIKVLLVVGLIYSIYFHVTLHKNSSSISNSPTEVTWKQADVLDESYPIPISNQGLGFNYTEIEKVIWQIARADSKQLQVNADTTKQLELACSFIDENLSPIELVRLKYLLTKSLPGEVGRQVKDLLLAYCKYLKVHRAALAKINSTQDEEQLVLLKNFMTATEKLQKDTFSRGYLNDLFSRKNSNLRYFTNSRIINLRKDLSQAEKQVLLLNLQEAYRNELSELRDYDN